MSEPSDKSQQGDGPKDIVICPHCQTRVLPGSENHCPACRQSLANSGPGPFVADSAAAVGSDESSNVRIRGSIVKRARSNDAQAIVTMVRQFIPDDEKIYFAQYLGVQGMFGLGEHSFGYLTDRRVAAIRVRSFGEVIYQDGFLEDVNSSVVYQPSKVMLYVIVLLLFLLALPTFGVALLLLPFAGRIFYAYKKSGIVFWIREGVSVYLFTNRNLLGRANRLTRESTKLREDRIQSVRIA